MPDFRSRDYGPTLTIERLDPSLPMPQYAKEGDSGFDLYAFLDLNDGDMLVLDPQSTYKVCLGIRAAIPEGWEAQVRPRSSMSARGITVQLGTIDSGYRGMWYASITNTSDTPYALMHLDRIAQAVLAPVTRANIVEGVVSTDTERGEAGFGSTGR